MARYSVPGVGLTTQAAGSPTGTTMLGLAAYWMASASAGYRLRRLKAGVETTTGVVPTSQQIRLAVYRITAAGTNTNIVTTAGQALETWTPADPTGGLIVPNSATASTSVPTVSANPIDTFPFNSQGYLDIPWDYIEELVCPAGAANGLGFVLLTNAMPTNHFLVVTPTIEV